MDGREGHSRLKEQLRKIPECAWEMVGVRGWAMNMPGVLGDGQIMLLLKAMLRGLDITL